MLEEALSDKYRTSSVQTVDEALACLNSDGFNLILLDKVLPDGKGEDVADLAYRHGIPVIVMSGYPDEIKPLEESVPLRLVNPFGVNALLGAVKAALASEIQIT
jgi:DNA-binding NtrC family response regulator